LLPVMATRAPSARKRRAVSNPMPLLPPVTRARLSFNLLILNSPLGRRGRHDRASMKGKHSHAGSFGLDFHFWF
jgi:hypothetical protein